MKGPSRGALELNCLFVVVVVLLVTLQLTLHRKQKETVLKLWERGAEGEDHSPQDSPHKDSPNSLHHTNAHNDENALGDGEDGGVLAAPVAPNIHRSFPKRKAPYVRKAKKNKKKKKYRKGKQGKSDFRDGDGDLEKSPKKHDKKWKAKQNAKTKGNNNKHGNEGKVKE